MVLVERDGGWPVGWHLHRRRLVVVGFVGDPVPCGRLERYEVPGLGVIVVYPTTPKMRCQGADDQSSVEFGVGSEAATASSARRKGRGNVRPRFPARRRIPAAALPDSQYLRGT